jgi:hypothetical protein
MFIPHPVVYQYIIKEHQKVFPQLSFEDVVHARLESGRCTGQPKWHDQELKMFEVASERDLLYILLPDVDLMIPGSQINLGEKNCPMQLAHQLIYVRNGVPILYHFLVESFVIDAHPQCAILLQYQND